MRSSMVVARRKKSQESSSSAGVLKKYRRLNRRRHCLRKEYKKLRSLLPDAQRKSQLRRKVGVVDAAYRYICELQSALISKFSSSGVPAELAGVLGGRGKVATTSDVRALALHLIQKSSSNMAATASAASFQDSSEPSSAQKGARRTKV